MNKLFIFSRLESDLLVTGMACRMEATTDGNGLSLRHWLLKKTLNSTV